jgi:hypothetical protein
MLVHNVFFSLKDSSPAARQMLLKACHKCLTDHPGVTFFACGTLVDSLKRPVNDRDFDVALHIVFTDLAAHDRYQVSERHRAFIGENQPNWEKVRVFDSITEGLPAA